MVSFHELQELFLSSHAQGILDDEELFFLYGESGQKILIFAMRILEGFLWTI